MTAPVLAIRDLEVAFATEGGRVAAVSGTTFDVPRNRTVALVGESGSGKTVISQSILGILPKNARVERGAIWFSDPRTDAPPVDLATLPAASPERRDIQGSRISIIFQEPMSSLSPLHTIGDQIGETRAHPRGCLGRARPASAPSTCWTGSASGSRRRRSTATRSSSRAACASGR